MTPRGWLAIVLGLVAAPAFAHPLAPSLLELRELDGGRVEVAWKTTLFRAPGAAPEPALPPHCRAMTQPLTGTRDGATRSRWTVDCGAAGLVGHTVGVTDPGSSAPSAVVRVTLAGGRMVEGIVSPEHALTVPPPPHVLALARDHALLGMRHTLRAPDHLLFLLGLVLLAGGGRRLVATIVAFVLAHSLTLTLATLGLVDAPAPAVAAAIAASVLVLAVELARGPARPTVVGRYSWATATVFGLLHGLAFASVLRDARLPGGDDPLALLAFNAGIEAGQLLFVLTVVGLRRAAGAIGGRVPWIGIRWVPVYVMGSLAVFWSIERAAALLR